MVPLFPARLRVSVSPCLRGEKIEGSSMAKPIRMAVVGAGSIGIRGALEHFKVRDFTDRVVLQAVCDTVPGRAAAAAEKYGAPEAFDDYDELLAKGDVDALTIGTPIGLHYEQGVKAV